MTNRAAEAQRRAERLEILNEVSRLATSTLDALEMYRAISARLQPVLGFERSAIVFFTEGGGSITTWASYGIEAPGADTGQFYGIPGFYAPLLSGEKEVQQVDPNEHDGPLAQALQRTGMRRLVHVALRSEGRLIGVLAHGFLDPEPRPREEEELLVAVAEQIGPALANARLHAEMRRQAALNARLLESLPDMLYRIDQHSIVRGFVPGRGISPAAPVEKIMHRVIDDFLPPWVAAKGRVLIAEALEHGAAGPIEYDIYRDGATRTHEVRAVDCGNAEVLIMIRDLTEAKRTERALLEAQERLRQAQRLEAIGRLAGGIAHDFNNLLTVIRTQCALIERAKEAPERVRDDAEIIRRAAGRAAELTSQLLAFGRQQLLRPEVLALDELVTSMEPLLRSVLGEDLALEIRAGAPDVCVKADAASLEQALLNLAVNARDATPGGGQVVVETRLQSDALLLMVRDSGCGMNEATRRQAFEPFFSTKESGSGLGLATVYGIVAQSGGDVELDSEVGRGTEVRIRLPRAYAAAARPGARAAESAGGGSETLLLVEDETLVREAACVALEGAGYRVIPAAGAGEAFAAFEKRGDDLDLVVTDVVMPGESGVTLAGRLRAVRPNLPVLFVTGYASSENLDPKAQLLRKPYDVDELLRAVRAALGAKSATQPS